MNNKTQKRSKTHPECSTGHRKYSHIDFQMMGTGGLGATEETICNFPAPLFRTVNGDGNRNSYVFEIRLLNLTYDFCSF